MEPANVTLNMRQNGAFKKRYVLKDKLSKTPADWGGYAARMQVRSSDGKLLASIATDDGGIVLGAEPGSIDITIPVDVMLTIPPQSANYDFVLDAPNGDPIPLFYGRAIIAQGETHD